MTGLPEAARDDDGFTLVELVVATAILSLILLAVGGLMFSTTITQRTVSAVNEASSSGQTVADGLRTQLRSSAEFRLATVDGHDQLLIARVARGGTTATYDCRAWYFARDEQLLRSTTWPVAGATTLPTGPGSVATWGVLLDGVTPRASATGVFGSGPGGTITIEFDVASDDRNEPTALRLTAVGGTGGGTTCWD